MEVFLSEAFVAALLKGSLIAAVPLLLAGLGEQFSQRAGVLNIGVDGVMLSGAYTGFVVALLTGSLWMGFGAAMVTGAAVGLIVAFLCVRLGLNQIIVGIAVMLTASGLTTLFHQFQFSRTYPRLPAADILPIPFLANLPAVGTGIFQHHPLVYIALLSPIAFAFVYRRTFLGLNLTAAGDKPAALDAAGVNVVRTRTLALMVSGALAGLGGAFLSQVSAGLFVPHMTNGSGFIAIVLAMLGRGRPSWVLGGALLFGTCLSATTALQVAGVDVSSDLINTLPFVMVMLVLIFFGRNARLPASLGTHYQRGSR